MRAKAWLYLTAVVQERGSDLGIGRIVDGLVAQLSIDRDKALLSGFEHNVPVVGEVKYCEFTRTRRMLALEMIVSEGCGMRAHAATRAWTRLCKFVKGMQGMQMPCGCRPTYGQL